MNDGVHRMDWLAAASAMAPGSVDFLYVDPPFNTGARKRTPPGAAKVGRSVEASFADAFGSTAEFLAWLRPRVEASLPALKPSASLAIHVDWRTSHRVRVMLDELLGEDRFVNHLIWSYGLGGSGPRCFARKHDDILVYCVDPARAHFEPPMVPATSRRLRGRLKKATDVLDVPALNNMARERTGYPTQKPLELLEMLVGAFAPPGGRVWDPCCGSGTTLVAATRLGRAVVGGDVSPQAVRLTRERLAGSDALGPRGPA